MKKLLTIMLACVAINSATAQIQINPIVGLNTFFLSTDPPSGESQTQVGWTIGLNIKSGGNVYFQPGVHYLSMMNGVEINASSGAVSPSYKDDLSIIRIPLLVGIRLFPESGPMGFNLNVHGGLSPSLLLSATDHATGADRKDIYNTVGASFTVGAGVELFIFTFDVELDYGLTKLYAKPETIYGVTYDGKPSGVRFNLGVKF